MAPAAASQVSVSVLLVLVRITLGTSRLFEGHQTSVNTTVGQNLSLPCIVADQNQHLIQFQWHKDSENQILVVFNPHYDGNISEGFELVKRNGTTSLRGSIMHLYGVTEKDSGKYVCSITVYPHGSIKSSTIVHVKAPDVRLEVTSRNRTFIEGDDVDILCVSDPPAESYSLSCTQSNLTLMSLNGSFRIQNIPRQCRNLTCRPLWNSSAPGLRSLRADVQLSVDYLDVECNSTSQIELDVGSDLIITCRAGSSTLHPLQFVWMKENTSLSDNPAINMWSVNLDQSGIYTLRVQADNYPDLYRQKDFIITVINTTHTDHQSSTTSVTTSTEESELTQLTSSSSTTSTIYSTVHSSSIAPSTGDTTTVQALNNESSATTSTHTSSGAPLSSARQNIPSSPSTSSSSTEFTNMHPNTSTTIFTSTSASSSMTSTPNVFLTKDKKDQTNRMSHAVYVVIPVLLLVVLVGFLYRGYLKQKKMDLPPSFKPPPPPVKYTSSRSGDVQMTEVFVPRNVI